ncbi:MAG: membrane integrity-associated transporter subunit PqiC [Verrucomicrobia bacterium]|nr:membrane integrity-associated transporter subunit PqiC [Verrucomicrobiota bacterium]
MKNPIARRALSALLATGLLAGCSAAQQYYRLSADGPAPAAARGASVGVGPVALPGYVDRAELVFQSNANQFQIPGNVHWAGTLQDNIARTLAADLARRRGWGNVASYPWDAAVAGTLRYQVVLNVRQFHAVSGVGAILETTWTIENPRAGRGVIVRQGNVNFQEPIIGDGYGPVVAAESRLIARLADEIARALPAR